jgi:hypothetical protein
MRMDQIKLAADLSQDDTQQQESAPIKADDLRKLSDLELVLCGGGDGGICW